MRTMLWLAVVTACIAPMAHGQADATGGITITSRPPGCTVYLSGDVELVTTTPVTLQEKLQGMYVVHAVRPGYEAWHRTLVLAPGTTQSITIDLAAKTRYKAGLRSLVIPGWGQYYAGEKQRSVLWGLAALSSGVVAAVYESRYRDRREDWEESLRRFEQAGTIQEKEEAKTEVFRRQDRAYDAQTDRRWAWGIVAGVWVANFLDAFVFFPSEQEFSHLPLTLSPTPDGRGSMVSLTLEY